MAKHAAPTVPTPSGVVIIRPIVVSSAEAYLGRMRTLTQAPAGRHARG